MNFFRGDENLKKHFGNDFSRQLNHLQSSWRMGFAAFKSTLLAALETANIWLAIMNSLRGVRLNSNAHHFSSEVCSDFSLSVTTGCQCFIISTISSRMNSQWSWAHDLLTLKRFLSLISSFLLTRPDFLIKRTIKASKFFVNLMEVWLNVLAEFFSKTMKGGEARRKEKLAVSV